MQTNEQTTQQLLKLKNRFYLLVYIYLKIGFCHYVFIKFY